MSSTALRAPRPGLSLAAVLSACALFEVLLYRVLRPLLRAESDLVPGWVLSATEGGGRFLLNLASLLGLFLLGGAVYRLVRPGFVHNRMGHLSFALVGGIHILMYAALLLAPERLSALGVGVNRAQVLQQLSFVCMAILLVATMLPLRAPGRLKVGAALLLLPLLCHFYTYWAVVQGNGYPAQLDVLSLGQAMLAVAAALGVVCFCPWPPRQGAAFAAGAAALVFFAAGALSLLDSQLLARVGYAAFGVRLPLIRSLQGLYLVSLGNFVFAVVLLLCQKAGPYRLRGFGLLLVGLGGYQVQEGYRMALWLLGLYAILRSAEGHRQRAGVS